MRTLLVLSLMMAVKVSAETVDVMVLGTYHFANPGLDLHNAHMDDVLSTHRQREVAAVVNGLAVFRPTVVAVESVGDGSSDRAHPKYADYLAGMEFHNRNEIYQIGFRLARQLQLDKVIGIDAPGTFPFEQLLQFAVENGTLTELQRSIDEVGSWTKKLESQAKVSTVGALLRQLNDPERIRAEHAWYMQKLVYGAGARQPGANLVGQWTVRNLSICARLVQSVKPGDRVVVVFGSGHSYLLRQCVLEMPGWRLVEPGEFLAP
nr:DUF5694 domain-containing protein [uncultured Rhodoferax sp.]